MPFNMSDLILHKKAFLDNDECNYLIEEYERRQNEHGLEMCPHASTNIITYSTFKRIELKPKTEGFQIVHSATEKMINLYHNYIESFQSFHVMQRYCLMYSHMYRLLKYETGAEIHPHSDHDPFVYGSCTFNLNDSYTGGDLSFWNGKHKIKLEKGDALIFPADYFWVHAVDPILSGVRYSTNSFLQKIPSTLKEEVLQLVESADLEDPKYFDNTRYDIK